jgi:hypothetical protein
VNRPSPDSPAVTAAGARGEHWEWSVLSQQWTALSDLGFERVSLLVGTDQENLCFRLGSGQPIRQAQEDAIPKLPTSEYAVTRQL